MLKEQKNTLFAQGILKSKDLQLKSFNGFNAITGSIILEWTEGNRLNNTRIRIFSKQRDGGKGYESIRDLMENKRDKDSYGDSAERIRLIGSVNWNIYKNRQGIIRQDTQLNASFVAPANQNQPDRVFADMDLNIQDYKEDENKNGELTGDLKVKAFNVGYKGNINPINNLYITKDVMGDDLEQFTEVFPLGYTSEFEVTFYNYAEVDQEQPESHGFGKQMNTGIVRNYVHKNVITFAQTDKVEPVEEEDFTDAVNKIKAKYEEIQNQGTGAPAKEVAQATEKIATATAGFGKQANVSDSSVPDFF